MKPPPYQQPDHPNYWGRKPYHLAGHSFHPLDTPISEARPILESLALWKALAPLFEDALEVIQLARVRLAGSNFVKRHGLEVLHEHSMVEVRLAKEGGTIPVAMRDSLSRKKWPGMESQPESDLLALFALGGGWWGLKHLATWAARQEEGLLSEAEELPEGYRILMSAKERTFQAFARLVRLHGQKPKNGEAEALERFATLLDPARLALDCPLPTDAPALTTRREMLANAHHRALEGNALARQEREARAQLEENARQLRRRGGQAIRKAHRPYKSRALVAFRTQRLKPDGRPRQLEDLTHRIHDHLTVIPPEALPAGSTLPTFDTLKRWLRPHWRRCKSHHQKRG